MAPATDLNHIRKFVPAHPDSSHPVALVLLHVTGGDENSLLSLGNQLWLGAALLGLRAKVLENGMPPSFRRFTEPGFVNVRSRTEELAQFIRAAFERYGFSERMVVAYFNGANLPASLILLHPISLQAQFSSPVMVPLLPDLIRDFSHLSVFIGAAHLDRSFHPAKPRNRQVW
jgi:phospholipase/carboxylesterase